MFEKNYLALPDVAKIKAIYNYKKGQSLLLMSRYAGVALVVSDAYFRRFALADESWWQNTCWTDIVVVQGGRVLENQEIRLHELFDEFPVFRAKFIAQNKEQAKLGSVLKLLNFGEDEKHFIDALNYPKYGYGGKLRNYKSEADSASFFCQKERAGELTISDGHCDEILKIYCAEKLPLKNDFRENKIKSNILFCLSVVSMKYSSAHYLKTTDNCPREVPDFLRVYALGLFNKAVEIHARYNCSPIPSAQVPKIRLILAGDVTTCLGSLADDLMRYSTHRVEDIYTSIVPPAWQA